MAEQTNNLATIELTDKLKSLYAQYKSVTSKRIALEAELQAGGWLNETKNAVPSFVHQKLCRVIALYVEENQLAKCVLALKRLQYASEEITALSILAEMSAKKSETDK